MNVPINSSITISLHALHLLINHLVLGNVRLKVAVLVLPFILEGAQLLLDLSSAVLGKSQTKKCEAEFLVLSTDNVGFAKLVHTGPSGGILHDSLKHSIHMA